MNRVLSTWCGYYSKIISIINIPHYSNWQNIHPICCCGNRRLTTKKICHLLLCSVECYFNIPKRTIKLIYRTSINLCTKMSYWYVACAYRSDSNLRQIHISRNCFWNILNIKRKYCKKMQKGLPTGFTPMNVLFSQMISNMKVVDTKINIIHTSNTCYQTKRDSICRLNVHL